MSGFGGSGWGSGPWGGSSFRGNFLYDITIDDVCVITDGSEGSFIVDAFANDSCIITDDVEYGTLLRVVQATALSLYSVRVRFSNDIDLIFPPLSDPTNYTIPGLTVLGVTLSGVDNVTLHTTPAQDAIVYTVTVAQGRSLNGDLLGLEDFASFLGFVLIPSFIAGAISSTQVDLIFSTEMNPDAAFTSTGSYTIQGGSGVTIPILSVTISGSVPIRRVSLRLTAPLQSMETYAAIVSSAVTSILGQVVSPDTYLFRWADMSRPTQGVPIEIPIEDFSGEVTGGLLGNPAGQVFFSPAYEAVGATSAIELESVSVCTRAYDQYTFPALLDPPALYTFGPGVTSTLSSGFILWAPAEKLGLFKSKLSDFEQEDVLPKIYDFSTGSLESPIGDNPAIATLRETIDITRASFLNDSRWRIFPGTGGFVFTTADNTTPIGSGPTTIRKLSVPGIDVRDPYDPMTITDDVDVSMNSNVYTSNGITLTDSVQTELFYEVTASDVLNLVDQASRSLTIEISASDNSSVTDTSLTSLTYARAVLEASLISDQAGTALVVEVLTLDYFGILDDVVPQII
jgi:hypothetical protein